MDGRGRPLPELQASKLRALPASNSEVFLSLLSAKSLADMPCDFYTDTG